MFSVLALLSLVWVASCAEDDPVDSECASYTYDDDIKSIVDAKCATPYCHGSNSGSGDWTSYSLLKTALDDGSFSKEVLEDMTMPKGSSLGDSELESIRCWYEAGYPEK